MLFDLVCDNSLAVLEIGDRQTVSGAMKQSIRDFIFER